MSKRKHHFTVTSFAELAKAYPLAVTEKVIPEVREQKADYAYIAKLLDCKIAVPGIEITPEAGEVITPANSVSAKEPTPHFLNKGKAHGDA
jgi:hypothetical protein